MDRRFAILCWNKNNNIKQLIDLLPAQSKIAIFYKAGIDMIATTNVDSILLDEKYDTVAKARNFIIKSYKERQANIRYLHILEDNVDILKDPSEFINDVEYMMRLLDIKSWFNTINDRCNFVYQKYNPRLKLTLNDESLSDIKLKELLFTSHSNTAWTIFDLIDAADNELYLSEDYTIAMFYIIEFFANRRNTKKSGQLYYMNQYPTVSSEYGVFKTLPFETDNDLNLQKTMQKEDAIFKEKKVDYHPDNNIDSILEEVYEKILTRSERI